MKYVLFLFFLQPIVHAEEIHQWAFPWIANQDGQWSTHLIITNPSQDPSTYTLKAYRGDGQTQEIQGTIAANITKIIKTGEIFDQLGSGSGYSVYLSSTNSQLRSEYLLWGLSENMPGSPASGKALPLNSKQYQWSLDVLSRQSSSFSAVVVVNPNDANQEISWSAFTSQNKKSMVKKTLSLKPWEPTIIILNEVLPNETDMLRMEIQGEFPLLATGFLFSPNREPAIIEAQENIVLPNDVTPLTDQDFPAQDANKEKLGKFLYWDKIISGNQNISCGTCHHTMAGTGDGLSLPIGEGGHGLGVARDTGGNTTPVVERVPRNAPPVFNLGATEFETFFHDGRVTKNDNHASGFDSPAGDDLLSGLDSALATQAMFPPTSATEMRGQSGENTVADASELSDIWSLLTQRVMANDTYKQLFEDAFPGLNVPQDVTFVHIANAIAAYEATEFRADKTPFDQYLRGQKSALSWSQKRGMSLFYGKAKCADCHSGSLLSDQDFHAIGIPPIGPGKGDGLNGHDDFGREQVTSDSADRYLFRTPLLRNVSLTGPWGHNGAYDSLEAMVRHNLNPQNALDNYDANQVVVPSRADLDSLDFVVLNDPASMDALKAGITLESVVLTEDEISDLMEFLNALTDPRFLDMRSKFPRTVPSGLPVFD